MSYGTDGNVALGLAQHANLSKGVNLYFDNLFSLIGLLDKLTRLGYGGTRTFQGNRVFKEVGFSDKGAVFKQKRGFVQSKTIGALEIVLVVTSCIPLEPMVTAVRYSRDEKKTHVRMPGSVASYNQHMGGKDLNDQFVSTYSCSIRSK
ncbi:hypothetical protein ILUMI_14846 [Ignelater luminosus]|uniref:PiggyBac transposable element-derived protein domain-containing protein n=1 Tax=Ignelater luminosus TaxID=2038154 RepID=A0A8K0G7E4_IGNLU|nr:hypothetical protein ILUMI_14846 [Ignelater luminosus]